MTEERKDLPKLKTERLWLTPWTLAEEDIAQLYAYAKDPDVGPNAGWKPHESPEESKEIIETLFLPNYVFAIREKNPDGSAGRIIGSIGLEADRRRENVKSLEMGYSLGKAAWGHGYMTEAAEAVIDYAFSYLDLVILAICTGPENKRSQRVIEKCGFQYEGRQRMGYHIYDGTDRDNLIFSLTREEWEARKEK